MAEMKQFLREQMDVLKGVNAPPEDDPLKISTERMAIYVGVVALVLPKSLLAGDVTFMKCLAGTGSDLVLMSFQQLFKAGGHVS